MPVTHLPTPEACCSGGPHYRSPAASDRGGAQATCGHPHPTPSPMGLACTLHCLRGPEPKRAGASETPTSTLQASWDSCVIHLGSCHHCPWSWGAWLSCLVDPLSCVPPRPSPALFYLGDTRLLGPCTNTKPGVFPTTISSSPLGAMNIPKDSPTEGTV